MESSLLIILVSSLLQLQRVSFETSMNCLGFLMGVVFLVQILGLYGYSAYRVNFQVNSSITDVVNLKTRFSPLIGDLELNVFEKNPVRQCLKLNYHLVGFLKKFICCLVLVFGEGDAIAQLRTLTIMHLGMLVLTIWVRPYVMGVLNLLKIASDTHLVIILLVLA